MTIPSMDRCVAVIGKICRGCEKQYVDREMRDLLGPEFDTTEPEDGYRVDWRTDYIGYLLETGQTPDGNQPYAFKIY